MSRRAFLSALLLASMLLSVSGQQPPKPSPSPAQQDKPGDADQDVVRITTNLVQVDAVVTKDGKQVTDLKPEDFEISEDGRPQKITNFSYVSNVPVTSPSVDPGPAAKDKNGLPVAPVVAHPHDVRRTVALIVDDLGMSFESMGHLKQQMRKFLDQQLQPNDLVAIIRTGGDVGALQQFTTDKRVLRNAIDHLRWNVCSRTGLYVFSPVRPAGFEDTAALCSTQVLRNSLRVFRFVLEGMGNLPGRKSMVIFSDNLPIPKTEAQPLEAGGSPADNSGDSISYAALRKVTEVAIRSSVVIYAVDTRGLQYTGPTAADKITYPARNIVQPDNIIGRIMSARSASLLAGREGADLISRQTGGFLIQNSNDNGLQRVMDDQRGYYLIGYRPSDETFNRRFHHIKARVKRRGLTVRTREGFYGVTEDEARSPELTARDQMERALISPFGADEITVRLTSFFANEATAGSLLRSFVYIDAHNLTFEDQPDGWHATTLDLSGILFGDNGKVISRQDQTGKLRLRGPSYERVMRDGIVYGFDMPVKQFGAFQFRVAVRDSATSRIGAAGQFIEVPDLRDNRLWLSGIVIHGAGILHDRSNTQTESPSAPFSASTDQAKAADDEITSGPGVRRFHQGATLVFVYAIYNALVDQGTHQPQLTTQTRLFRDGKPIYTSDPMPPDLTGQRDPQRPTTGAQLKLGPELMPGEYVLQIIVEDRLAKDKNRKATQWIDFEVIP
jgi:VWFA-related protein